MTRAELEGRNIYVALYRDDASSEAEAVFGSLRQEYELDSSKSSGAELGFFEDWEEMHPEQKVISVRVGPRGGVDVEGAYEIFDVVQKVRSTGREKGQAMTLQMCFRLDRLAGRTFGLRESKEFSDRLRASEWSLSSDKRCELVPLEQLITEI